MRDRSRGRSHHSHVWDEGDSSAPLRGTRLGTLSQTSRNAVKHAASDLASEEEDGGRPSLPDNLGRPSIQATSRQNSSTSPPFARTIPCNTTAGSKERKHGTQTAGQPFALTECQAVPRADARQVHSSSCFRSCRSPRRRSCPTRRCASPPCRRASRSHCRRGPCSEWRMRPWGCSAHRGEAR